MSEGVPELLTTIEVAERLGVSLRRVQQFAKDGRLKPLRYVHGSPVFTGPVVDAFAKQPRRQGWPKGKPRKPAGDTAVTPAGQSQ